VYDCVRRDGVQAGGSEGGGGHKIDAEIGRNIFDKRQDLEIGASGLFSLALRRVDDDY
jgi:hypothetical protein